MFNPKWFRTITEDNLAKLDMENIFLSWDRARFPGEVADRVTALTMGVKGGVWYVLSVQHGHIADVRVGERKPPVAPLLATQWDRRKPVSGDAPRQFTEADWQRLSDMLTAAQQATPTDWEWACESAGLDGRDPALLGFRRLAPNGVCIGTLMRAGDSFVVRYPSRLPKKRSSRRLAVQKKRAALGLGPYGKLTPQTSRKESYQYAREMQRLWRYFRANKHRSQAVWVTLPNGNTVGEIVLRPKPLSAEEQALREKGQRLVAQMEQLVQTDQGFRNWLQEGFDQVESGQVVSYDGDGWPEGG